MYKFTVVLEEMFENEMTDRYLEKIFERNRVPLRDEGIFILGNSYLVTEIDNDLDLEVTDPKSILVRAECSPVDLEVLLNNDTGWQLRQGGEYIASN